MKFHVNQVAPAEIVFAHSFRRGRRELQTRQMPARFVDDYLSYLLARASYAVYKEFDAEVKAAGLSSLEWRVLATLASADGRAQGGNPGDGLTIGTLAREVLAQQPTLTKLIQRMSKSGLVERLADPDDARKTRVASTPAGRKLVAGLLARAKAHEAALLAQFKGDEVQALKKILHTLIDRFDSGQRK
jgi:DNA-binding MarR family transcriptional regulator